MDNSEKLPTKGTHDEDNQNKNTTQYVFDTTIRKLFIWFLFIITCILFGDTVTKDIP